MNTKNIILIFFLSFLVFASCSQTSKNVKSSENNFLIVEEVDPVMIPLEGEVSNKNSEISGLCWYGDLLLLIPQYPNFLTENENGVIYFLKRNQILEFLSNVNSSPLLVNQFTISLNGFDELFNKGSGFESATIIDNDIFFTIETIKNGKTDSYIVSGIIDSNTLSITLDKKKLHAIKSDVQIFNISCETIIEFNDQLIPIYEANGKNVNPKPTSYVFNKNVELINEISLPNIEYRITDATEVDDLGYFWTINYFYPGEEKKLNPGFDNIAQKFGIGKTHINSKVVERLLRFRITNEGITLENTPPIYIKLDGKDSRNWEGLVKLDNLGFLIATDRFPETILAFIKYDFDVESKK